MAAAHTSRAPLPTTPSPPAPRPSVPAASAARGCPAGAAGGSAVRRKPLPAGRPREFYESHNRRLKAMRLAIALLESGILTPQQARNRAIRRAARRIGVHPPSTATCRMVRALLP